MQSNSHREADCQLSSTEREKEKNKHSQQIQETIAARRQAQGSRTQAGCGQGGNMNEEHPCGPCEGSEGARVIGRSLGQTEEGASTESGTTEHPYECKDLCR
jgi:hypothetical protein